jgi:hypothetical protein
LPTTAEEVKAVKPSPPGKGDHEVVDEVGFLQVHTGSFRRPLPTTAEEVKAVKPSPLEKGDHEVVDEVWGQLLCSRAGLGPASTE